ncbi:hypothetical protein MGAST_19000 [Mycobacterium gastri 'Wayne']|nr:hypothetical protein MGAST_19000 [Mycobacterium gastri 'Wayne']
MDLGFTGSKAVVTGGARVWGAVTDAFAAVSERWGQLNCLVHTIGPGHGYFEETDDAAWDAAFTLGTMSGVRSIRAALPLLRAADCSHRDAVRALYSAAESTPGRLHRIKGGAGQRHQELVEKPC